MQTTEHSPLGSAESLRFYSTALAIPVERLTSLPPLEGADFQLTNHRRDILDRVRKVSLRPPPKAAELLNSGLSELLRNSDYPTRQSHSLGLLVPSAIRHWANPYLMRAEYLLSAIVASAGSLQGGGVWRLPKIDSGSGWSPIVVVNAQHKSGILIRVRTDASTSIPSWFGEKLTWADVFPEQVGRLRSWRFEGFSCSAHEDALKNTSWLSGRAPDFAIDERFYWNRAIEVSTGIRWLAALASSREGRAAEETGISSHYLSYERAGDVLSRLTGADWATLDVGCAGKTTRIEYIPDRWKEEADLYSTADYPDLGSQNSAVAFVDAEAVDEGHHSHIVVTHGNCGGVRVASAMGRQAATKDHRSYSVADVRDLMAAFAEAFVRIAGEQVDDRVLSVLLAPDRGPGLLSSLAEQLATAFLATNITLWRRLTSEGPMSVLLEHRRADLANKRRSGDLRPRILNDDLVRYPITGVPIAEHPLGPLWKVSRTSPVDLNEHVSLFPIWSGGKLYGIIEIVDRDDKRDATWPNLLKSLFDHLSHSLPHLGGTEYRELEARRAVRHQVRPTLNALERGVSKLVQLSREKRSPANQQELHHREGDIRRIISDLAVFLDGLTGAPGEKPRSKGDAVLDSASSILQSAVGPPVNLLHQIRAEFEAVRTQMESRKLRLSVARVDPTIRLSIPAPVLQIIIANLATNAAKYAANGTEITVSTSRTDLGSVQLDFANFGSVMTDRERGLIFNKNFRSFIATKSETKGDGLGLYHVKGVISLLGGSVEYSAKPVSARGATRHNIRVTFPAKKVADQGEGEARV